MLMVLGNTIQDYVKETDQTVKGTEMPKSCFALQQFQKTVKVAKKIN